LADRYEAEPASPLVAKAFGGDRMGIVFVSFFAARILSGKTDQADR
jgi:hypothetical protein